MTTAIFVGGSPHTVRLKPGDNVFSIVRSESPNTKFIFSPGVYRMQSIVPKDHDVFVGEGPAILNGSKLLYMQPDAGLWSATETRAKYGPGHCSPDHPRCWILNDLFIDDHIQLPVEKPSDLGPGKWFYDEASEKVYIDTNPSGHTVELGSLAAAFYGEATGIEITHLIVEKYASPPQHGAIGGYPRVGQGRGVQGWSVVSTEVRWNHGTGIALGSGAHVDSCNIHHNGQKGIGAVGDGDVITNNEISYNNYAGYNPGWEAGGSKFSKTDHLILRSNYVHDNVGGGLWTDIDNIHALFEKNRIENTGEGIRHEISYDAIIRNNLLKGNDGGIVIVCSPNVEVYGNVIEVPPGRRNLGIEVYGGERGVGAYGPRVAQNDSVHHNVITYFGPDATSGVHSDLTPNTFDYNEYHLLAGGDNHWNFNGGTKTLTSMRQQGFEVHTTVSTTPANSADPTRIPDGKY
jgi:hypothetical protein